MSQSIKRQKIKKIYKRQIFPLQSPKGMPDILPADQPWWEKIRKVGKEIADFYNFSRIDTPILEPVGLSERSIGETTDIVEKQMFTLRTKGGDRLVLRPEGTASVMRAYFQHNLSRLGQPFKLYYIGPMFRYERPQAGRLRQFHHFGFEIVGGDDDPIYDAQIILVAYRLIKKLKLDNLAIQLNSIGCKVCRLAYRKRLQNYYKNKLNKICPNCRRRFNDNPLRLLDCQEESCLLIKAEAPSTIDYLCHSCRSHFRSVLEYLDGLNLPYTLNPQLVRGLDYYNRTVFEIFVNANSENDEPKFNFALAGGGRYDYLGEIMLKKRVPAVGVSVGIERTIEVMKGLEVPGLPINQAKVFLIYMGSEAKKRSLSLIEEFYSAGIKVFESLGRESLRAQLKIADKEKSELALILGQKEVFEDSIIIRDMQSGAQETVPLNKVVEEVKRRLK